MLNEPLLFVSFVAVQLAIGAPAKAFFTLNVLQKRLYSSFTRFQAVVAGTVFFLIPNLTGIGGESGIVLVLLLLNLVAHSFIVAYFYERTDDLLVPILVNFGYNTLFAVGGIVLLL